MKPTCEQYDIFSDTPHHGGNELDISGMITYTTADKWLRIGGALAFVITQTHFQSPSSQGFRRFRINAADRLVPVSVDDMKALKPFPEAANKTSVVVFRKETAQPSYPVPYRVWTKSGTFTRAIPPALPLAAVLDRISERGCEANPVEGEGSPWAILPPGRFASVSRISGRSDSVHGRKGISTDLNGVYFLSIEASDQTTRVVKVSTRPTAGRARIGPARSFWIEPTFLYPLLKGARDFETCYLKRRHRLFALVPNRGITREAYDAGDDCLNTACPRTKRYFEAYESRLRQRSTWRGRMANAPFYAIYNVGSYTFAPYKVIWAEQSGTFEAAVATSDDVPLVGRRPYVPDHKIFFVAFEDPLPAYFLCGLLAAPLVKEFVESHNISIQVGNIFKHMRLPSFDGTQQAHRQLAHEVKLAHEQHDATIRARLVSRLRSEAERIIEASL